MTSRTDKIMAKELVDWHLLHASREGEVSTDKALFHRQAAAIAPVN